MLLVLKPIEGFTTWMMTGVAAIVALMISHVTPATHLISTGCFRRGVICLVASLLAGAWVKYKCIAIDANLSSLDSLHKQMISELKSIEEMHKQGITQEQLLKEIWAPFPRFFVFIVKLISRKKLTPEGSGVRSLAYITLASVLQVLLAATGVLVLAFGF